MDLQNAIIEHLMDIGLDDRRIVEFFAPDGTANQAQWRCEDNYIVCYTTTRIFGGPDHDKFGVTLYKPVGKGARTNPKEWKLCWSGRYATRKTAKKRATAIYYKHSPEAAKRHGINK